MNRTLTTCRHLYNNALAERKKQAELNRLKKSFDIFPWGKYPRFRGRERYNSFTYPQSGFSLKDGILTLSKIGNIRIIQHREIEGKIKTCTIKRDIDQWYVTFSCEIDDPVPVKIKTRTGIDVGLIDLITLNNGEQIKPPKFLRKSEDKLIKEQKRLSRKEKRSENRKRQGIKVAKVHRKIRNQRKDFAHQVSRNLVL